MRIAWRLFFGASLWLGWSHVSGAEEVVQDDVLRFPILLVDNLEKFEKEPSGLSVDAGRGRKQELPFRRPVPLANLTLQAIVTSSDSKLSYPGPWITGDRFTGSIALIAAGPPAEIKAGRVCFGVEIRSSDDRLLWECTQELKTTPGLSSAISWLPLPLPEGGLVPGAQAGTAKLLLRTQAFGDDGKELKASPELPCPLGVLACWGDPRLERSLPNDSRPSVLIIGFDTLRADRLGCYGYRKRATSPAVDALAARGYLFERCYSPTSWTLPAFQSLFTGLHPAQLGYGTGPLHDPSEDLGAKVRYGRAANLMDTLRVEKGLYSLASTSGGMLEPWQNNFLKGFSAFWANPSPALATGPARTESAENAEHLLALWNAHCGPRLGFYHTYECHTPYADTRFARALPPGRIQAPFGEGAYLAGGQKALQADYTEEERAYVEALYDGDLASADEGLKHLLEGVTASGLDSRTWIVLTADHGEEFWEHGGISHGHSLYDELLHVPLIIVPPGGLKEAVRCSEFVSLLDLFPTLCELMGAKAPPNLLGRSLRPWLDPDAAKHAGPRREALPGISVACGTYHGPSRWALRQGDWKYIRSEETAAWAKDEAHRKTMRLEPEELYDLGKDPKEQQNLAGNKDFEEQRVRLAERLKLLREGPLHPIEPSPSAKTLTLPPIDPVLLEKLKKLGY